MFILNISIKQTKFVCNGGSIISRGNLTMTLSIEIYDSEEFKDIHTVWLTRSGIHEFRKKLFNTDHRLKDIYCFFYWKLNVVTMTQKEFWRYTSFYNFHIVE